MKYLVANLRAAFAIFVAAGAITIFSFSAHIRDGSQEPWLMVGVVVGLMVLFGLVVWVRSRESYDTDSDAESFYYLGFIYTLITLVATFVPLLASGHKAPSPHLVLGLFGLGLITTFVGLAGRIFFLQPRSEQSNDETSQRLTQAYLGAARELEATTLQMATLATALEQAANKSHERLADSIEKCHEKIIDITIRSHESIAASQMNASEQMTNESVRLVKATTAGITVATTEATKRIVHLCVDTTENVTSALDQIAKQLMALKLPPEELGTRLQERMQILISATNDTSNAFVALGKNISPLCAELASTTAHVSSAATSLGSFSNITVATSSALERGSETIEMLRKNAEAMGPVIDATSGSIDKMGTTVTELGERVSTSVSDAKLFAESITVLAKGASSAAPIFQELGMQIVDFRHKLAETLSAIGGASDFAKEITQAHANTSKELALGVDLVKEYQVTLHNLSRELESDLVASERAVLKVHENLVKATDLLVAHLE